MFISVLRPSYWLLCIAIGRHNLGDAEIFFAAFHVPVLRSSSAVWSGSGVGLGNTTVLDKSQIIFSGKGKFYI